MKSTLAKVLAATYALALVGCQTTQSDKTTKTLQPTSPIVARISVSDQQMEVVREGVVVARYPVSTSRYGIGDQWNSYRTPLGTMVVDKKIGDGVPRGGKFYHRSFTGEVFDLAGYDPRVQREHDSILTRIIWLRGLEGRNSNAYGRGIYIHGTNQEHLVGQPVSYGCIRMRNDDVLRLYSIMPVGAQVVIQRASLETSPVDMRSNWSARRFARLPVQGQESSDVPN